MDLAILGGEPAFAETLHVGRPNIGDRAALHARIDDMLDRRWLSNNGRYVLEFEHRLAEYLGVEHCITVCNATLGLEIVAKATGLTGEVIIPSFTFIATAHALSWVGLTPVFCDVDPRTHCIDPARVEEHITERTSAILGVHVWGQPCDVEPLQEIAERHRLRLMFDAAHAFGCSHQGKRVGGFGDAEVFSFHATKFLNSFEGGAITTNDAALAERMRLMRNFGFAGYDLVSSEGTNAKMTEVCAAMGLTSLEAIEDIIGTNRRNYEAYQRGLAGVPGVRLFMYDEAEENNYQYIALQVERTDIFSRDDLVRVLHAENVFARRYFYPGCHSMEPYRTAHPDAAAFLPNTIRLSDESLILPTGTAVNNTDINMICDIIRLAVSSAEEVQRGARAALMHK